MIRDASGLRLAVSKGAAGESLIDAAPRSGGGIEAGLRIAEVCLGGLGTVSVVTSGLGPKRWPLRDHQCAASIPVIACLGSQYAGWACRTASEVSALGSGPGRALLARRAAVRRVSATATRRARAVLVLEDAKPRRRPWSRRSPPTAACKPTD